MKKLILALILISAAQSYAQVSDRSATAALTSTCSNATSTCDTAGVTVFGQLNDVLGPQTVEMNTQNYGLAQVTLRGSYTGSVVNFEYSDDGGTSWYPEVCSRSDINVQESSEAVNSNATEGIECSVGAAKKFRVRQSAISTGGPIVTVTLTAGLIEPAPTVALSNVSASRAFLNNPGSGATQLVAAVANQSIRIAGYYYQSNAAGATFKLVYGTGVNCGTGTTDLTETYQTNVLSVVEEPGPAAAIVVPAGNAVCVSLGAAITGAAGVQYAQF